MAKRRGASKKVSKKTTTKRKPVTNKRDSLKAKKQRILVNFIRFFAFFIICLALYFVTNNYVLWVLFGIGAIIGGAISFALLLVMIGFLLIKKKR